MRFTDILGTDALLWAVQPSSAIAEIGTSHGFDVSELCTPRFCDAVVAHILGSYCFQSRFDRVVDAAAVMHVVLFEELLRDQWHGC